MSYMDDRSLISNNKKTKNPGSKTNLTLWKSKYHNGGHVQTEDEKKTEDDYIENLKKQVYFMEMELKLLKEREKEIEKSGGFTQLFNDDRDAGQHIQQLKTKYANMRKMIDSKNEDLTNKKREVHGLNISLKSKLEALKQLEKEIYDKLVNLEDISQQKLHNLENEYFIKNKDRMDLEASNRIAEMDIKNELKTNQELEFYLKNNEKFENMAYQEYEEEMNTIEALTNKKTRQYEEINLKMKEIDKKLNEDPFYKKELEKNEIFKHKVKEVERETLEVNSTIQCLELANEFLLNKKEETISERKKLLNTNDELKHEIEAKMQLNEIRIQKKMKENNSEELKKLDAHLKSVNECIIDTEAKVVKEQEKSRMFISELLKLNIELRNRQEKQKRLITSNEEKVTELAEFKSKFENLKNEHLNLKEKINKETTDNQLLKNRYKALLEEFSQVNSKYDFISQNYDYTTNLKKLSLEDMRNLTQTNNLVNDTILNFVGKVGNFKKQNIQSLIQLDNEV